MLMKLWRRPLVQRPSMGSWITYGLGLGEPEPAGLHRDVSGRLSDRGNPELAVRLSARAYQGTYIDTRHTEIDKLDPRTSATMRPVRASSGDSSTWCGRPQRTATPRAAAHDPALETRIQSFELAYRMQGEAAEGV